MKQAIDIRELRATIRKLEREISMELSEQGSCCGVTMEQCHTLLELGRNQEQINLKTLAALLELEKSTVSRGVDSLVRRGLVNRQVDEENRRSVLLSLSGDGKRTAETIDRNCDSYYQQIFERIPINKHHQVVESFRLFVDAMVRIRRETGDIVECDPSCIPEKRRKHNEKKRG